MRRLFASGPFSVGMVLALDDDAHDHARVLRLASGARIELFDGAGALARGALTSDRRSARVTIDEVERAPAPRDIVLLQALAKGDKLDDVVRIASEVGVAAVHLVETEHAVARLDARKLERLGRIAREATRQSEQAWTPAIEGPTALLSAAAAAPPHAIRLVLAPRGAPGPPPDAAPDTAYWLVIGPEGGLSPAEERDLEALGYARWTLRAGILRTETAAAVALGALIARP